MLGCRMVRLGRELGDIGKPAVQMGLAVIHQARGHAGDFIGHVGPVNRPGSMWIASQVAQQQVGLLVSPASELCLVVGGG